MKHLQSKDLQIVDNNVYVYSKGPGMLLVHAEWCGHCVRFMPQYKKLSEKLKDTFPFTAVEESQMNKQTQKKIGVKGYPSLYFFDESGKIIEMYTEERDNDKILKKICTVYHKCTSAY
jgi:thiol-disulfide isomerase/thioredoxin